MATTSCSTGTATGLRSRRTILRMKIRCFRCGVQESIFGLTSTRTIMYVACVRAGNESHFWGHQPLHLSVRGLWAIAKAVGQLRSKMLGRGDQLLTSTLALGEILVKPTPEGALSTIDK